jgi:hypothetical protein
MPSEVPQGKGGTERSSMWCASPIALAVIGLIGTGVGAVLQGFWNTRLEREKFEFSLIQKALDTANKDDAAQNLKFLVDVGLIKEFDAAKISSIASNPKALPVFLGAAFRNDLITVHDAKSVLTHLGFYTGQIDDQVDSSFRKAVADFQASRNLLPDSYIGAQTYAKLREAYPEYFNTKNPK